MSETPDAPVMPETSRRASKRRADSALLLGPQAKQRALGVRAARAIPAGAVVDVGSVDSATARSPGR